MSGGEGNALRDDGSDLAALQQIIMHYIKKSWRTTSSQTTVRKRNMMIKKMTTCMLVDNKDAGVQLALTNDNKRN